MNTITIITILLAVLHADSYKLTLVKHQVYCKDYEAALVNLQSMSDRTSEEYFFYSAVTRFSLEDKSAQQYIDELLYRNDTSHRHYAVAQLMREDMLQWREHDMGAIARKMRHVEDRLNNGQAGYATQKIQKDIEDRLRKQIKDLEAKLNNKKNVNAATNRQATPMKDSSINKLPGRGIVFNKRLAAISAAWGKLPEAERTKAAASIINELPPRHRMMIENYFKKINTLEHK